MTLPLLRRVATEHAHTRTHALARSHAHKHTHAEGEGSERGGGSVGNAGVSAAFTAARTLQFISRRFDLGRSQLVF